MHVCSSHPQLSFTRHSFLPKAKEVNMPKSIQPYILLQPLGLIDMSKELLKFWACDVRLINFFSQGSGVICMGNGWHHCSKGFSALYSYCVSVRSVQARPTYPAVVLGRCLGKKLLRTSDVMAMFYAIVFDIFYLCARPVLVGRLDPMLRGLVSWIQSFHTAFCYFRRHVITKRVSEEFSAGSAPCKSFGNRCF